ncbi:MAG: 16S rRNA (cytidine(1402)-2'-O)-methyltransferase [bacterium]|nr:16S rRNA (cytidine(1402)-2'-O)-methyltransferase [bacterium]
MKLFIVATPIGNLSDFSKRAKETLEQVDLILAEDTRQTAKLLNFFGIEKPIISYHQHSKLMKLEQIKGLLLDNKNLALACDSGTPGISDPAGELIDFLHKEIPQIEIIPIPGPSAIISALSVCGFSANQFLFVGFPPTKTKRKKFFEEALKYTKTIVFYESPFRLIKTLENIKEELEKNSQKRKIFVIKEISKMFEKSWRGEIDTVIKNLKSEKIRGEFVIILSPAA